MNILHNVSLRNSNTLSLKARASALVDITDTSELKAACDWARASSVALVPLGQGSNVVLVGDLDALVVRLGSRGIEVLDDAADSVLLKVAAGEDWHSLVQWCLERGYFGLENLALIPGTAGAAPIQNIGAYGVELHSCLERVHAVEIDTGKDLVLAASECGFGYRDSIFKGSLRDKVIISGIELRLSRLPDINIRYPSLAALFDGRRVQDVTPIEVFDAVVSIRRSRLPDPANLPNAGSFFKNPLVTATRAAQLSEKFPGLPVFPQGEDGAKLAAAWMIEHCGWKGYRDGNIGVHPDHALVMVNYGDGSGEELLALAERVVGAVRDIFGLELVIEPRIYGGAM